MFCYSRHTRVLLARGAAQAHDARRGTAVFLLLLQGSMERAISVRSACDLRAISAQRGDLLQEG